MLFVFKQYIKPTETMDTRERLENALPDPTSDLHLSDFVGAIQDIFSDNARKYPDRLCVVETASSMMPQREFSYKQIDEASNLIAHHFLQRGIQRDEVIMIYAYRGVDLCIAIIAILKAGATFSVVDPAYPPDRQITYLDVARPRGLIVIEKASRDEGRLSARVRTWIQEHLELRAELPGLEVLNDGSVKGGSFTQDTNDVLLEQQPLKSKHPGVIVGPDSTPTLSFTSGSEGRPKGVRGRHFSLTHYYPWMAEAFNLSDKDQFTMLSGIAHDPIQRDIFTPFFLGARLLVPAKEDIQHTRLAEWMQTYGATVTHLTPAMGQILVGGASAEFPSLRNAFFVGDQLIKRDCRLLQQLAPNCNIINMFGTTETQRAVSYFALPSRNEDPEYLSRMPSVIPAGRGMQNVDLLVVDRASLEQGKPRLCGVNEQGEIFVRAGGLAEGYLGSEDLNREKFIPNFFLKNPNIWQENEQRTLKSTGPQEPWRNFWKGPRDRLYRTGDLGRYITESGGNVECTGRADNQIKIRGFRIEIGEIDTYICQHPLVRENVTLVRRNKDEEPTLVSYIVPEIKEWTPWLEKKGQLDDVEDDTMIGMLKRFRLLREDVRASLRTKLPSYAVPSVVIPLRTLPLTPNYKVDRKVLPYPDAAELATAASASRTARSQWTEIQKTVGEIWASRIGIPTETLDLDNGFIDSGGHSLRAQEVLFDIKRWAKISISMNTLFQNSSLRDFSNVIAAALEDREKKADSTPPEMDYALDGEVLKVKSLPSSFPTGVVKVETILITGGTGFLGASILEKILNRSDGVRVIALVRAKSSSEAFTRIKTSLIAYNSWSDSWEARLKVIPGDLSKPKLGLSPEVWYLLESTVDVVIHNGARVHWIYTYTSLKPTNVLSTLDCITLCANGKPKHLTFVSSTAVLDTKYYAAVITPISESDPLDHSRKCLSTGYAQSKFVSEYLVREAGRRGLTGTVVRPGYITGNPTGGICPLDDFLLRMLKGSIQLSSRPDLGSNTINLVPVSYCANIVVSASLYPPHQQSVAVLHVTPRPQLSFNAFLETLQRYGYTAPKVPYPIWRSSLEDYVSASSTAEPHALLPLFDWVTTDLPSDTNSRNLDDRNAQAVLSRANSGDDSSDHEDGIKETWVEMTQEIVSTYLAYMVEIGFVPPPTAGEGEVGEIKKLALPIVKMSEEQRRALKLVGRGGRG
ncbi:hypothetical protein BDR22DRAFT_876217 [Usnea florida]